MMGLGGMFRPSLGLVLGCTMALCACASSDDSEKKAVGDRVAVFDARQETLKPKDGAEIVLSEAVEISSWPMVSANATHQMGHGVLNDNLKRLWNADLEDFESGEDGALTQPVIDQGRIFVMDAAAVVFALDQKTGKSLWKRALAPSEEQDVVLDGGGVAAAGFNVFATTGYGEFLALKAETGEILWRIALPAPAASAPTLEGGYAYITTKANQVVAVSLGTKAIAWVYTGLQQSTGIAGGAAPAVFDQTVVTALSSGEVVAIHRDTGRSLWFDSLSEEGKLGLSDIVADPVVAYNMVFAAPVGGGHLTALSLATGARLWQHPMGLVYPPAVTGNGVFITTSDQKLMALTVKGDLVWTVDLPKDEDQMWFGPLVAGSKVLVLNQQGDLLVLSPATGQILSTLSLGKEVAAPPLIVQKTMFVLTKNGYVLAYGS
jgi:outer membrane protein assembly factor BamB